MQNYFNELADYLTANLTGEEVFTATFSGEDSDFVRFNQSKVRQAGNVQQRYLSVDLILGQKHAPGTVTLTGVAEDDHTRLLELLSELRGKIGSLPEDPHLLYSTEVTNSEQHGENLLPAAEESVSRILAAGEGRDLVGILAQGGILNGFANSQGQRNWFSTYSYNFDWCYYVGGDKAVKSTFAGFEWDQAAFERKVADADRQLRVLEGEPKTIDPGHYRVYLAPVALADYAGMMSWAGFGLKSHKTKQTVLLKMAEEGARLHPALTIRENTAEGVAPNFQSSGYVKPGSVTMIENGEFRDCLVSPRSAKEFDAVPNGAGEREMPESLDIAAGDIPESEALARLGTGVWINNVWYLNFSDRPNCRITGLTRFACFWVEDGKVVAPVNVMRFDETAYRALGENLIGLTKEREMILSSGTYGARDTGSVRIPGALIDNFHFNL